MKLLAYTIGGQKIGVDIKTWEEPVLSGNTAFIGIEDIDPIPSDYEEISSALNWDNFGYDAGLSESQIKQEIRKLKPADTSGLTEEEIEIFENQSVAPNRFYRERSGAATTTSVDLVVFDELIAEFEEGIYDLCCFFVASTYSTKKSMKYGIEIDGQQACILSEMTIVVNDINDEIPIVFRRDIPLSAGTHTISIKFGTENKSTTKIYGSTISLTKVG